MKARSLSPRELAVSAILHGEWDPIGCGVPEDEYDAYAPFVTHLLGSPLAFEDEPDDTAALIASFLGWVRLEMMNLVVGSFECDSKAARALVDGRTALLALSNERRAT